MSQGLQGERARGSRSTEGSSRSGYPDDRVGPHRDHPIPLSVVDPGGRWRDRPRDNLPAPFTSFVGRELQVTELIRLLEQARLVTLVGSPGVGKTRLALEVAGQLRELFDDGVWMVELAALSEPSLVPSAVARGLGLRADANRPAVEMMAEYLSDRETLLVLDNCEHMLDAVAPLVGRLAAASPSLHVLATSREPLGLIGEVAWRVPSLSLPEPTVAEHGTAGTAERGDASAVRVVLQSEAGRLFVDRARRVRPDFEITEASARGVAEICHTLDGIPLAIELAAARVRALSAHQIAARLDDRFSILTGGSRGALPRQRTLRALVDWSHGLLSEAERTLLRRLSVFAGGWTLEAAETVCAFGAGSGTPDPLDLLAGLVDKSLVVAEELQGEVRYGLLETIRQYAAEELRGAGEESALRDRHCDWFLRLAEQTEPELIGPEQVQGLDRLEAEHGNLRAALRWCVQKPDAASGLRFGAALWRFWEGRNHLSDGRAWLDELLALPPPSDAPVLECAARFAAGRMAFLQGDGETSRRFLEPCLARSHDLGAMDLVARILHQLGHLDRDRGELAEARAQYEAGERIWHERGDAHGITISLWALGRLTLIEGAVDEGRALIQESLRRCRELGHLTDITRLLLLLGIAECDLGRLDEARTYFTEGLEIAASLRDRGRVAANLDGCAMLAAAEGHRERALRLAAMAAAIGETTGTVLARDEQRRIEARLEPIRRAVGETTCEQISQEARGATIDEAIAYALGDESEAPQAGVTDDPSGGPARLSPREVEIARLVGRGLTNRQIADALVISERTAEWHVAKLRAKLDLDTRAQLSVWAARHGFAPDPDA